MFCVFNIYIGTYKTSTGSPDGRFKL